MLVYNVTMPIPAAPVGKEFGYDFQFAIFVKREENVTIFLDTYLYEPAQSPTIIKDCIYLAVEDLRRLYAPYLAIEMGEGKAKIAYTHPLKEQKEVVLDNDDMVKINGIAYINALKVMNHSFDKEIKQFGNLDVLAIDAEKSIKEAFPSMLRFKCYTDRLTHKTIGYQNYAIWMDEANRIIPYRMYIPLSYRSDVPNKTIVCFHGGDANPDYMFIHTKDAIARYAETYGYILLSICSYRKYTFFGGSKLPVGDCLIPPTTPNPCDLTTDECIWCDIAEKSVLLQIEDAKRRYALDEKHMYALGNSGGTLGIFQQVTYIQKPYFKAAVCSGGMPTATFLDVDNLKSKNTSFLLLAASEDEFDGQYTVHKGYPHLKEGGLSVDCKVVGGGTHLLGWTHALDIIFDYFEQFYYKMSC